MFSSSPACRVSIICFALVITLLCSMYASRAPAQSVPTTEDDCSGIPGATLPRLGRINHPAVYYGRSNDPRIPALYRDFDGLLIEENLVREIFPMLPLIFFDEGKSEIPGRYRLFTSAEETTGFRENVIPGGTLEKYTHVLNIIGYRLRTFPHTRISIAGYDSKQPAAAESGNIGEARAIAVRQYLLDIWKIDPSRITLAPSGGYPRARSNPKDSVASSENRRVEILSDDMEIVGPLVQVDFRRYPQPEGITFTMQNSIPIETIERREIEITRDGRRWHTLAGLGPSDTVAPEYNWGFGGNEDSIPVDEVPYVAVLTVYLKDGRRCSSAPLEIPVMIVNDERKRRERLIDKTRDIYSLLIFDFGSSRIGSIAHSTLSTFVVESLRPGARISVTGHASYEENPDKLAAARAAATASVIRRLAARNGFDSLESRGVGDKAPLYPVTLPEGRFFNRTVRIRVETPTGMEALPRE